MIRYFKSLPFRDQIGIIIIVQMAIIPPLLMTGGADWLTAYREATVTGRYGIDTWNPYPAYWLFAPFAALPEQFSWLLWNLFGAAGVIYALKQLNGRYLPFALSLPCFWLFYSGQIEGVIAMGLALGLSASPIVAGAGILLLSFKPQLGLLVIVFIIYQRRDYRMFIIPTAVYALSLLQWGWWLPEWLNSVLGKDFSGYATNLSLWPYSLALLPLLWLWRRSLKAWLLVQSVLMPYFAVYSLALLFIVWLPAWANAALWIVYLTAAFLPVAIPGYVIVLAMLGYVVFGQVGGELVPMPAFVKNGRFADG